MKKIRRFLQPLKNISVKQLFSKDLFVYLIVAELIFWSPCIITAIMAFYNPYWWTVFGAIVAFWAGPFTPAILLQIGLAFGLKKLFSIRRKKDDANSDTDV